MARARNLKPGFFSDAELTECDFWVRLLFAGLWTIADRSGRIEDRPKQIKIDIFPADTVDVEDGLRQLAERHLIVRYKSSSRQYILVKNFERHQNPHKNEPASTLPAPEPHHTSTLPAPEQSGGLLTPDSPFIDSGLLTVDSGESEGGGVAVDAADAAPIAKKSSRLAVPKPVPRPIPDDFALTDRMREWAAKKGWPPDFIEAQTERFREYYCGHQDKKHTDWEAGWRTWMLKSADFVAQTRASPNGRADPETMIDPDRYKGDRYLAVKGGR